jgi:hypothetical protein
VNDLTHAYVARMPCCDSVVGLFVDDGEKDTGRDIAKMITRGRRIERMTISLARTLGAMMYRCECVPDAAEVKVRREASRARRRAFGGDPFPKRRRRV